MMLGFSPLVFDEENDQHEQELTILKYDGEHIAYFTEYPEEGQITLG
jgi:predicted GNAT family acetyltransferase